MRDGRPPGPPRSGCRPSSPAGAHTPSAECLAAAAASAKQASPVRRVDFHSMLPGALHVLRKVEVPVGKG